MGKSKSPLHAVVTGLKMVMDMAMAMAMDMDMDMDENKKTVSTVVEGC